jgi:cytochrome c-type protein NapB
MTMIAAAALAVGVGLAAAQEVPSLRDLSDLEDSSVVPEMFQIDESGRKERAYRQQPPVIPHRVDKYEIDLKVNQCLRCHDWPYNVQEKAPKISETHYESREGKRLDFVAGTRWFCTQCHVPQVETQPLVENEFRPAVIERR